MSNSEFPETWISRLGTRVGWLFSPVLLISLILLTLFTAEGLQWDFDNKSIERKSSVEIKDIKNASIYFDEKDMGKSPRILDTTSTAKIGIKVTKESRIDWQKTFKPKPGFVRTYYPVLYPTSLDFKDEQIIADEVFSNNVSDAFFYTRKENGKTLLFRYSIVKQIFGSRIQNNLFTDITSLVTDVVSGALSNFTIVPGNTDRLALLVIDKQKVVVIGENNYQFQLPNIVPKATDTFYWSPNDGHLIYKTGNEINSISPTTGRILVLHRSTSTEEIASVQFLDEANVIYKIQTPTVTDLLQNAYEGGHVQKIELPNIDNIRKNNLIKAYNLLEKENLILIQTAENIFTYNVVTFDLKKFNLYRGEQILYLDALNRKILTVNSINQNQFIFTDLEQDERKVFTIENVGDNEKLEKVLVFNGSQNMLIDYENFVVRSDIDGSNQQKLTNFKTPQAVLASRQDDQIHLIVKDLRPEGTESKILSDIEKNNRFNLYIERFEN